MTLGMLVLAVGVACSGPEPPCEIRVYDPLLIELCKPAGAKPTSASR